MPLDCSICLREKLTVLSFPQRLNRSIHKLEIIYSDICEPMRTETQGKSKYFVTFIDDYSRWCEVRFLSKKNDLLNAFKEFKVMVEKQTGATVKSLQSDNGKEYCNKEFDAYLKEHRIKRRFTVPHTPQQNGVAERRNRTLVEMARCLMLQSGLGPSFWAEAIATANFIRNRCTAKALNGSIPYEVWTNSRVRLNFLKTFGCTVYVLDKSPAKDKFAPRDMEGTFVGYADEAKGFRIWLTHGKRVIITRDVRFLNELTEDIEYRTWIDTNPIPQLVDEVELQQKKEELHLQTEEELEP